MDFYDYYYQTDKAGGEMPLQALCMNTTFYLTDNTPERGRLTFLEGYMHQPIPDALAPHLGYTDDRENLFQAWCDRQPHVNLHPLAGDMVIFYSHVPHQGAKLGADPDGEIRANIVLHYQQNPMFPASILLATPNSPLIRWATPGRFPLLIHSCVTVMAG